MPEMPYGVAKCRTGTPEEWYFDVYFYGWDEYEIKEWVKNHTDK
jgi:predicted DNA-binding transcriptional regulator AlpA